MRTFIKLFSLVLAFITLGSAPALAIKPTTPTAFLAVTSMEIPGSVELSWHAVKGASEYTVSAARETADYWHILGTTAETNFQVNDLPEGTKYYFRIASNNRAGQSDWSDQVMQFSSKSKDLRAGLLQPANFHVGASSTELQNTVPSRKGELALAWSGVAGAKSYLVQICDSTQCGPSKKEAGTYNQISQDVYFRNLATTVRTEHLVTGLSSGRTYLFRIMGVDDNGKPGAYSMVQARTNP